MDAPPKYVTVGRSHLPATCDTPSNALLAPASPRNSLNYKQNSQHFLHPVFPAHCHSLSTREVGWGENPKEKKKTQNQKSSGHEGNFKRRRSWLIFFSNWVSHPGPHKAKNLSVPAGFEEELPRLSSKRIKKTRSVAQGSSRRKGGKKKKHTLFQ